MYYKVYTIYVGGTLRNLESISAELSRLHPLINYKSSPGNPKTLPSTCSYYLFLSILLFPSAMAQDHGMIGARICSTWGCGRAVHSIGRSMCCSACSVGSHARRCQRNVKETLRMSISEMHNGGLRASCGLWAYQLLFYVSSQFGAATYGSVVMVAFPKHSRPGQRQEDSLQLGPVVPRLIGGRQLSWYRRRLAHRLAELTQATERVEQCFGGERQLESNGLKCFSQADRG